MSKLLRHIAGCKLFKCVSKIGVFPTLLFAQLTIIFLSLCQPGRSFFFSSAVDALLGPKHLGSKRSCRAGGQKNLFSPNYRRVFRKRLTPPTYNIASKSRSGTPENRQLSRSARVPHINVIYLAGKLIYVKTLWQSSASCWTWLRLADGCVSSISHGEDIHQGLRRRLSCKVRVIPSCPEGN